MEIKLLVCDVDKTLLMPDEIKIHKDIISAVKVLINKGILFAVASGRRYESLKELFYEVWEDTIFICSDGSLVLYKDEVVYKSPIRETDLKRLIYLTELPDYHKYNGEIFKLVCFNEPQAEKIKACAKYYFNSIYNKNGYTEFVNIGVDKGLALKILQQKFKLYCENTACICDGENDTGLIHNSTYSYAVKNATDDIKRMCKYTTDDVVKTILQISEEGGSNV